MKLIESCKYKLARYLERNPLVNIFLYNNIIYFPFLLPHEKDFHGIKLLLKSNKSNLFLDVGANNGISSLGFRRLGYENPIYMFEPNIFIYKKFLKKFKVRNNFKVFNFGLGEKNEIKNIFFPFYKKVCLHYFGSSEKKYIIDSIKLTSPNYLHKIKIEKTQMALRKYDTLNIKKKIDFIKIDVEGHDLHVLKGMKKSIKKFNPIILVEYNTENFKEIYKFLNSYNAYIFKFDNKKFKKLKKIDFLKNNKSLARSHKKNLLSSRNVFFIPKNNLKKFNIKNLNDNYFS